MVERVYPAEPGRSKVDWGSTGLYLTLPHSTMVLRPPGSTGLYSTLPHSTMVLRVTWVYWTLLD